MLKYESQNTHNEVIYQQPDLKQAPNQGLITITMNFDPDASREL